MTHETALMSATGWFTTELEKSYSYLIWFSNYRDRRTNLATNVSRSHDHTNASHLGNRVDVCASLAGLTLLAFLAEGALGLPVFASAGAGLLKLMGPTSGFLWGFVGMAFLTGWMIERRFSYGFGRLFIAAFCSCNFAFYP